MTTLELSEHVGQLGTYRISGNGYLDLNIMVLDSRQTFGRIDYLISPVAPDAGCGHLWVERSKVKLITIK